MKIKISGTFEFTVNADQYVLSFQRYQLGERIICVKLFGNGRQLYLQKQYSAKADKKKYEWKIVSGVLPNMYREPSFIKNMIESLEIALKQQ